MNLSKIRVFTLLIFIFWSFSGFAQSGEPQKEKPKVPETKESVKKETKEESPGDKKTDKEKVSENKEKSGESKEKSGESKKNESQTDEKKTTETKEKKTEDKKETSSKINQSTSTPSKANDDKIETFEITGSYIRRSDIEGPSPIVVFDREQIEKSGYNSIGGFLQEQTTVFPFGTGGLRGLGSSRTLVLVNGQRLPASGNPYASGAASPDSIPLAAVDRVEVLKDGATAIYGSDAIGGVINVITKKNWDGLSVTAKLDVTEFSPGQFFKGGEFLRTSMAYGKTSSRLNFLTSLQYMGVTPLRRSDFKRVAHLTDVRPQFSSNYVTNQGIFPNPKCTRKYNGPLKAWQGACLDYIDSKFVAAPTDGVVASGPPNHVLNWVTDVDYDLSSNINVYSTLYLGYSLGKSTVYESFFNPPIKTQARSEWGLPNAPAGTPVTLFHRISELPDRETHEQGLTGGLILGAKGDLIKSWSWDVTLNNQINKGMRQNYNYAMTAPVKAAIEAGTYNPFGDPAKNSTEGFADSFESSDHYQVNWLEAKANGLLGDFFGFNWASAAGVSIANFEYKNSADARVINREFMGITSSEPTNGGRQLYAGFTEINGLYHNIETQLALRYDHYSDFGSTINPKIALKYQALNWMFLRASFGTGFKAPILQESYGPRLSYFANDAVDYKYCKDKGLEGNQCSSYGFEGVQGGNPDLKEETSRNFNVGFFMEPIRTSSLHKLSFGVDYWNVVVENTIGSDTDGLLRAEVINPNVSEKYNVEIRRDPQKDNQITFLDASLQNLGKEEAHGIDVLANYQVIDPVFKGKIDFGVDFTYMFHRYTSFYEELGKEMVLGRQTTPRWRNIARLGYSLAPFSGMLVATTTPKVEKQNRQGFTPAFTQFNLTTSYKSPWGGSFQLGIINILNQSPEHDLSNRSRVNTALYSPERTWFLAYRRDF